MDDECKIFDKVDKDHLINKVISVKLVTKLSEERNMRTIRNALAYFLYIGLVCVIIIGFERLSKDGQADTTTHAITPVSAPSFSCSNDEVIITLKKVMLNNWIPTKSAITQVMLTFINQEKFQAWALSEDERNKNGGKNLTKKEIVQKLRAYTEDEIMNNARFTYIRTINESPRELSCELTWENMDTAAADNKVMFTSPSTGKPVTLREYIRGATAGHIQNVKDWLNPIQYEVVIYDDGVTYGVRIVGNFGKYLNITPPIPDEIRQEWLDGK